VPGLHLRWSEHEARKPYARPFGVTFLADDGAAAGSIAVNGADLLYYRQFQAAVLRLAGELFVDPAVDGASDPQRAWLDVLGTLMPVVERIEVTPASSFTEPDGRAFELDVVIESSRPVRVSPASLLEYQDLQAALAHQTGRLFRNAIVESIDDPQQRQRAWMAALHDCVRRPDAGEAITEDWPWR
jgi:hypothetical protein